MAPVTYDPTQSTSTNLYLTWSDVNSDSVAKGGMNTVLYGYDLEWDQGTNTFT